jgi:hypothetical protein
VDCNIKGSLLPILKPGSKYIHHLHVMLARNRASHSKIIKSRYQNSLRWKSILTLFDLVHDKMSPENISSKIFVVELMLVYVIEYL